MESTISAMEGGFTMKKWNPTRCALVLTSVFLLSGCGQNNQSPTKEADSMINGMKLQVKEEGCFYIDGHTNLMMFYDYKLNKKIPICDQPNCKHSSINCKAYLPSGYVSAMGCYQDKIYFFDVEEPELPLYQAAKNGDNRKIVLKLNEGGKYDFAGISKPMYFRDNQLVFQMTYAKSLDEAVIDENGQERYFQQFWQIVSVDVTDGKLEVIKNPEKYRAEKEDIVVVDYIGERLVYRVETDNRRAYYLYDTKQSTNQLLYDDPVENALGRSYVGIVEGTDLLCYTDQDEEKSQIYLKNLETNEETCIFYELRDGRYIEANLVEGVLYYGFYREYGKDTEGDLYATYDIEKERTEMITKEQYFYAPDFITADWYVMTSDEGYICIPKEAYDTQDWSKIQVIGMI